MSGKKYLSIDPGKKNTGYAWFTDNGIPIENKSISDQNKFMDWLEAEDVSACELIIMETYRNRGGRANDWSSNETSQLIGMIKRFAYKNNIKIEDSESANLYIGLRFLNLYEKYGKRGQHVPDGLSALAHGVYVLQKLRIRKHEVLAK